MKRYVKTVMILSLLLMSKMAFAFPADPEPANDPPSAPIGTYMCSLAVLGIVFAFWCNAKKTENI